MPTILAINPRRSKKTTTKKRQVSRVKKRQASLKKPPKRSNPKGVKTMAKKRKRRAPAKVKTIVRYRTKKNPKRLARAVSKSIGGINVQDAAKGTIPMLIGALAAKFAAKKFADGGGEADNWTWKNYGFGLLGGFLAAFGTAAIFGAKKATAQKMMSGAFLLTAYKIFTNEIAPQNTTLDSWFSGEDESAFPNYGEDQDATMMLGENGQAFIQGSDGNYIPADDSHRDPYGDGVVPVNPQMGFADGSVPVNPQMGYGAEGGRPTTWADVHRAQGAY